MDDPLDLVLSGVCRRIDDSLLVLFEKVAIFSLYDVYSDNSVIIPNGVEKLIVTGELKYQITHPIKLVISPSAKKVVGAGCTLAEGSISYIISKSAGLGVVKGITEFGVNNICWYLCRDENNINIIIDTIREKSKVQIEMY